MANTLALLGQILDLLPALRSQYYHLLLVIGPTGSGKTPLLKALCHEHSIPYLNVNLALSEGLLDLSERERAVRVGRLLAGAVDEQAEDVIALDNIELLFDPALQLDPLLCLQGLSRNRTLIVAWGGNYVEGALTYAEPWHPEYHRYERPEATVLALS